MKNAFRKKLYSYNGILEGRRWIDMIIGFTAMGLIFLIAMAMMSMGK